MGQDHFINTAKKSFENTAKFKYFKCQHHGKLTFTINSHFNPHEDVIQEVLSFVAIMLQQTAADVNESAYGLPSVTWSLILYKPCGSHGAHTQLNSDPWLMFNFYAISAIVTILPPENHDSGFFHFLIAG